MHTWREMPKSESQPVYDLVLKGGRVIDERNGLDGPFDLAVKGSRIAAVAPAIEAGSAKVRDVAGCIVVPGLIDIHTHIYHKATSLSVDPGFVARRSGCTTLVDAGSAGAGNYDGFRDYVMAHSPYRILAFLNIFSPASSASTRTSRSARRRCARCCPCIGVSKRSKPTATGSSESKCASAAS